jgi:propanol-preferring alcohol dehydrogenase
MLAMVLERSGAPLQPRQVPVPPPGKDQLLIRVNSCGVCRTDLHVVDGDLPDPKLPLIPGHEIVGRIVKAGAAVATLAPGQRVGVPWLGHSCGVCEYCRRGQENLCDHPGFTGYRLDGGYAEYVLADSRYCFPIPDTYSSIQAAPLLCAGLIGYRAYRMAGDGPRLGLYGFGAAAHILVQIAAAQGREVFAFTRPGDTAGQAFARSLGACWAGGSDIAPPRPLNAAIIFAPVGALLPPALEAVGKGGTVVCAGIHMTDIPAFPYRILWGERVVRSVANLTRRDGLEFFQLIARFPVRTQVEPFSLLEANRALEALRRGEIQGAAVLQIRDDTSD